MQISLVIPLRNEENSAGPLLESIARQSRMPDEVVVVDAGSTDRTHEVLARASAGFPVRVLSRGPLYPGAARNEGVAAARHDWIAFTDGGIRLEPSWLEVLSETASRTRADVVLGNYHPACHSFFQENAALAYVAPLGASGLRGPFVASMLVRREALEAVGGFPPFRAAEDLILLERLLCPPRRVAEAPEARIHWEIPASAAELFCKFALYSYHNLVAQRGRHWHFGVARHYFLTALVALAAAPLAGWLVLGLFPLMLLARATKASWQKRRSFSFPTLRPHRIVHTALILAVIDLATLAGTVRWLLRSPPRN